MTDAPTLSGDEIAALMSELRDSPLHSGGSARPFTFGTDTGRPMAALPVLDRMNDRLAKRIRDLVEPFARSKPSAAAEPAEVQSFETWRATQNEFVSLNIYSLRPLKGPMLIAIPPAFISRMVDAFYGGSGLGRPSRAREFTPTEERFLDKFSQSLMSALQEVWAEVVTVRPQLRSRETHVGFAAIARPDEAVTVCRFIVAAGEGPPATVEIIYPVAALRSVEHELAARSHDDALARSSEWRERLEAAVGEVRVQARTVLARPELSLSELMGLKVGDVIPVSLPAMVPLLVEGKPVALGTVGEHDGRAALKIEKMERKGMLA